MQTKTFKFKNGITIFTRIMGDSTKPAIVLLHGWPSSSLLWRNIMPVLAQDFFVLAPDLPGHGNSDKPLNVAYSLSFFRQFILDFFDAAGISKAHLAAHDLGGSGALSFAVHHSDRIQKFIIMNTSPYPVRSIRLKLSLYLLRQPWLSRFFLHPIILKQVLKTGIYNPSNTTPEVIALFRTPWVKDSTTVSAFSRTIGLPANELVEPVDKIKTIQIPTLILWGKKDLYFPFSTARRLHQDIAASRLVGVENAGHFCQEEEPEFIARTMHRFLIDEKI